MDGARRSPQGVDWSNQKTTFTLKSGISIGLAAHNVSTRKRPASERKPAISWGTAPPEVAQPKEPAAAPVAPAAVAETAPEASGVVDVDASMGGTVLGKRKDAPKEAANAPTTKEPKGAVIPWSNFSKLPNAVLVETVSTVASLGPLPKLMAKKS